MTSTFPPSAIPDPEGVPAAEKSGHQQPDPFGKPTDEAGQPESEEDDEGARPKEDPRGE
jgi:hypothetical protein